MKFTKHVPGFSDAERKEFNFTTKEELFSNEIVDSFNTPLQSMVDGKLITKPFHQFSLCNDNKTLMVEHNNGHHWWVVGFITEGDPSTLGLPAWNPPPRKA